MSKGFPLRAVLLPTIKARKETRLVRVPPALALAALAPSTLLQLHPPSPEGWAAMGKLVKSVPCFSLELGSEIQEIPRTILRYLEHGEGGKEVNNPLVSIVIAVYNGEDFLRDALDSAFARTTRPARLSWSTMGPRTVAPRSQSRTGCALHPPGEPRTRSREEHGHVGRPRRVLRECRCRRHDAPWKVSVQMRYLQEHPEVTCVLGRLKNGSTPRRG